MKMLSGEAMYYELFSFVKNALIREKSLHEIQAEAEARNIISLSSGIEFSKIMGLSWREKVEDKVISRANEILARRLHGEPLQYLAGEAEFYGRPFGVDKNVLIPRHDTECVVEAAIKEIKRKAGSLARTLKILDIGTGPGTIIVTLALETKEIENIEFQAVDISEGALDVARSNARTLGAGARIKFLRSDIFECYENMARDEKFDIIISNPPYISEIEYAGLSPEVRNEPKIALTADDEGYYFYEKIIGGGSRFLCENGVFIFEIGHTMAAGVMEIAKKNGYSKHEIIKDIEGRDRGLKIWA